MQSWSSQHPFGTFESFQYDLQAGSIFFPFIHHQSDQFIIKVYMGYSALLHSAHFAPAL